MHKNSASTNDKPLQLCVTNVAREEWPQEKAPGNEVLHGSHLIHDLPLGVVILRYQQSVNILNKQGHVNHHGASTWKFSQAPTFSVPPQDFSLHLSQIQNTHQESSWLLAQASFMPFPTLEVICRINMVCCRVLMCMVLPRCLVCTWCRLWTRNHNCMFIHMVILIMSCHKHTKIRVIPFRYINLPKPHPRVYNIPHPEMSFQNL